MGCLLYMFWASHTYVGAVSLWVESYHEHHEPGCFGLIREQSLFMTGVGTEDRMVA